MGEFWYTEEGREKTVKLTVDERGEVIVRSPKPFGTVRIVAGLDSLDVINDKPVLIELLPDPHYRGVRSQRARITEVDPIRQDTSKDRTGKSRAAQDPDRDRKAQVRREANRADT